MSMATLRRNAASRGGTGSPPSVRPHRTRERLPGRHVELRAVMVLAMLCERMAPKLAMPTVLMTD